MPVEPPPSRWQFPDPADAGPTDLVGVGADLDPGTVLSAYRQGIFPMPMDNRLAWWSPEPRAVLPIGGLRVSRSLAKACRRFDLRVDTAFDDVIAACADPQRPGGWITDDLRGAYRQLHRLGWAHSVEAWEEDVLAGGLYGIAIGGFFAGESMFHHSSDASKVALVGLMGMLSAGGASLLDVQWLTPHLRSLGAVEVTRREYLSRLRGALALPLPEVFGGPPRRWHQA